MTLSDADVRQLAIELLTAETERDKQTRIGASNLANPCDRCLSAEFLGHARVSELADRPWMGRVLGTAFHGILDTRIKQKSELIARYPGALSEHHVNFAYIPGYGWVGGTIDLWIPADLQLIDWKGSTRQKVLLLIDFMRIQAGLEPIYGRTHRFIKLSEREYAEKMLDMAFKVQGYYGQQCLYMKGSGAKRASLVFLSRDGTGYFDNPALNRYDDETAVHDVWVLSFDYDEAYANALIQRGTDIWTALESGSTPADFTPHERCFFCSKEAQSLEKVPAVEFEGLVAA